MAFVVMKRIVIVMAGDTVRTMAMVKGGDFHHVPTIANITAHHAEYLCPSQRQKRKAGEDLAAGF